MTDRSLVLLSGGMDSVAALMWARKFSSCECIAIHYGQRHYSELAAAWDIAKALGVPFETFEFSSFSNLAPSELTGRMGTGVVVPNRNAFMLSIAGAVAMARGIDRIVVGCNADDAADFPDCREGFLWSMEETIRKASEADIEIVSPWLHMTKAEMLSSMAADPEAMAHIRRSVSCYHGRTPGCGECSACVKRARAFEACGLSEAP